jgi:hypothetical protein
MLLFKRILDFQKTGGGMLDKRGDKRFPVGAKYPIKTKITLIGRDAEGHLHTGDKHTQADWGGQLIDLSGNGANIRLHPAAIAASGDACCLKMELDQKLFEIDGTVAHFRVVQQFVSCGLVLKFPDAYTRKAYLQLMEPVVIGSTLEPVAANRVKQDMPGLTKEQFLGESETTLSIWRNSSDNNPKSFELLVHDYCIRGSMESPGLRFSYRDGAKVGRRISRPSIPIPISQGHQTEIYQFFQFIVQNLGKGIPAEPRKLLEMFAV